MIYSGLNYRKVQERSIFSFDSFFSLDSVSGSGLFGFSGNNQTFNFKFESGKIFDPESRYISSYQKNKTINLSGNVSGAFYDYYLNKILFCKNGSKNDFEIENFYLTTSSGLSLDLDVSVSSAGSGDFIISGLPSIFYSGVPFSGKIVKSGVGGSFDIFSGTLNDFSFQSGNLNIINSPIRVDPTGDIIFSGNFETKIKQEYLFHIDFNTSLGKRSKSFSITGDKIIYQSGYSFSVFDESAFVSFDGSVASGEDFNTERVGEYTFSQFLSIDSVYQTGLPFFVSLNYVSGITGNMSGMITGSILTAPGRGYRNEAVVAVSGINGVGVGAKVKGLTNSQGQVTEFKILNVGSGYQANPRFIVRSNIDTINVISGGSGYFSDPNFLISGSEVGPVSGYFLTEQPLGVITSPFFYGHSSGLSEVPNLIIYSVLSNLNIVSGGSGYTDHVSLVFSGGNGFGASGSGLIDFRVFEVKIADSGNGYSSAPSILFSGGEIEAAQGVVTILNGFISEVEITDQGLYKSVPTVLFSGGSPSITGLGSALTTGAITGSLIEDRGNNYLLAPVVTINSISGNGSLIKAVISSGAFGNIILSTGASGSGISGFYEKTFLNSFNLLTGELLFVDFKEDGFTGVSGLSYKNETVYLNEEILSINVSFRGYYDDFPMVALLNTSGFKNVTGSKLITGIR